MPPPPTHPCAVDLPEYGTKEELRDKLLLAIREGSEGGAGAGVARCWILQLPRRVGA